MDEDDPKNGDQFEQVNRDISLRVHFMMHMVILFCAVIAARSYRFRSLVRSPASLQKRHDRIRDNP